MAKSKRKVGPRRPGRKRRQTYVFVGKKKRQQIRELARFYPSLETLKGKSRITSQEQALLSRAKKQLRYSENLHPVTEKQAKQLRKQGLLVGHGVRAIRLRNTSANAKIRVHKDGIIVTSNGRKFEYHPVAPDIDALAEYGEMLLDRPDVRLIFLWTNRGRTNEGFEDIESWVEYLTSRFQQYHQVQDFALGIVAEIKGAKKKRA